MISVIIPVYNTADYLEECVRSVLEQTYRDLELILVDDGSVDGSGEICDRLALADRRIVVIHQKNAGVSTARNRALAAAHGDWFSFVDSDDWLEPDMYEKMLSLAEAKGADLVECDAFNDTGEKCEPRNTFRGCPNALLTFEGKEKFLWPYAFSPVLWNKLIAADLVRDVQFTTDIRYAEDTLFLISPMRRAKKIACMNDCFYHYRVAREGNVVSAPLNARCLDLIQANGVVADVMMQEGREDAAVQFVYSAVVSLLGKMAAAAPAEAEPYAKATGALAAAYRDQLPLLADNPKATRFRIFSVRLCAVAPRMAIQVWRMRNKLK